MSSPFSLSLDLVQSLLTSAPLDTASATPRRLTEEDSCNQEGRKEEGKGENPSWSCVTSYNTPNNNKNKNDSSNRSSGGGGGDHNDRHFSIRYYGFLPLPHIAALTADWRPCPCSLSPKPNTHATFIHLYMYHTTCLRKRGKGKVLLHTHVICSNTCGNVGNIRE